MLFLPICDKYVRFSVLLFVSVSVFVPHFGVLAWRLKCTKTVGPSSDVVH